MQWAIRSFITSSGESVRFVELYGIESRNSWIFTGELRGFSSSLSSMCLSLFTNVGYTMLYGLRSNLFYVALLQCFMAYG